MVIAPLPGDPAEDGIVHSKVFNNWRAWLLPIMLVVFVLGLLWVVFDDLADNQLEQVILEQHLLEVAEPYIGIALAIIGMAIFFGIIFSALIRAFRGHDR